MPNSRVTNARTAFYYAYIAPNRNLKGDRGIPISSDSCRVGSVFSERRVLRLWPFLCRPLWARACTPSLSRNWISYRSLRDFERQIARGGRRGAGSRGQRDVCVPFYLSGVDSSVFPVRGEAVTVCWQRVHASFWSSCLENHPSRASRRTHRMHDRNSRTGENFSSSSPRIPRDISCKFSATLQTPFHRRV